MKPLPPMLKNPPGGRYTIMQALAVWLHLLYGYDYDADPALPGFQEAQALAEEQIRPLIRTDKQAAKRMDQSAQLPTDKQYASALPKRTDTIWVDEANLLALAKEYGLGGDFSSIGMASEAMVAPPIEDDTSEIPTRKRGQKEIHHESFKVAIELMKDHPEMDQIEACRQAVKQCFKVLAERENDTEHDRQRKADLRKSKAASLDSKIRKFRVKQKQQLKP